MPRMPLGHRLRHARIALACVIVSACDQRVPAESPQQTELARMHAACVEAMVKSTCQVMTGPEAASTADVVFVAGIGPVDAKAYRELRASGDAMCSVVQKACQSDWGGAQCRTARGLWPAPSPG